MGLISLLEERRKKKERRELTALMESYYKKREVTKKSLCGDVYRIGSCGLSAVGAGAFSVLSSVGFLGSMYVIGERIFREDSPKLQDETLWFAFLLGGTMLASGWGAKELYHLTGRRYNLLKEHYTEYRKNRPESKA
jgi:hypothetical protein